MSTSNSSTGPDLRWQDRRAFLTCITAAAGWLDALAFLYLGKVFLSFMSGNLLFVGLGSANGDGDLLARAATALGAFLVGTTVGARLTGSRLAPGDARSPMGRTLALEAVLLAAFAVIWLAAGTPADHAVLSFALIAVGGGAMGVQAAVALALHLPNVATVAMTATLAQLGALIGWERREGSSVAAGTPAASLLVALCLAYLLAAIVVALLPAGRAVAFGPLLLLGAALVIGARDADYIGIGQEPKAAGA
jgi:uncharacterized membrane protein YoaK (UPF0700 family)